MQYHVNTQVNVLHVLSCSVFVVIRNGMKSVFMCECDLYGRYICYKNMVYICNVCCVHIIRPDKRHPIIRKPL